MGANSNQHVVMVCTAERGGIRAVVEGYKADGIFFRWNVLLLNSHVEDGFALRLGAATKAFFHLIWLLLRHRVKLVHCHSAMRRSFWRKSLFSLIARLKGIPVIFHLHGSELKVFIEEQPKLTKKIISWILSKQSAVVVLSESWMRYVKSISPRANIEIITNYVALPEIESCAADPSESEVVVLFLGLIGKRKGVYDLLPAFKDALIQYSAMRLIVGGNGEIDHAQALAGKLEIDKHVVFTGWVDGSAKMDLLRQAHILVLPSYNEGLPISLLEAMSWRVPVISTRVGGIPELVRDGLDGLLIDAGDREALTSAMVELAQDANLRARMGKEGRNRVEREFSKHVVLPKLEGLYRSFISSNTKQ